MNLYLVRHAHALPINGGSIRTDEERPLSAKGKRQVRGLADLFRRLEIVPSLMVTSPLIRARQTAEGVLEGLNLERERLRECRPLAPGGESKELAKFLRVLAVEEVVLVGHEPDLGLHAAWLLGCRGDGIHFAKAGAAHIRCDPVPGKGTGELLWLITPRFLPEAE